jgi:apolipoprotein N-acyltransferase
MKRLHPELLCLLAGLALPLAFAPYELFFLAILCPALLFHFWIGASPFAALRRGWLFGLGMFGAGVGWLHISINEFGGVNIVGALAVTLLLVAFLSLYPAVIGWAGRRLQRGSEALFLAGTAPALWAFGEWVRSWAFTGFPWLSLGYSQTGTPLAGFAPLGGVFAVSWAVAFVAGALLVAVSGAGKSRMFAALAIPAIIAVAWIADTRDWAREKGGFLDVALVQASIPQQLKWKDDLRQMSIELHLELTARHWNADIIVWPETSIPAFQHQVADLLEWLEESARLHGTDLFIGLPYLDRERHEYFNSLLLVNRPGEMYHKRHLVPFGEYLPFKSWLGGILRFLEIPMSDFSRGNDHKPILEGDNAIAGLSICYENVFGEEVRLALPEAELLINVSNDAWFGDSLAPHQHLQMAQMRTLETERYMLRATNSGISAVIDPKGRIIARAPQFEAAVVTAEVRRLDGLTPYARTGNLPVVIALLLVLTLPQMRTILKRGR